MAAYAALISLSQTTHLTTNQNKSLFSMDAAEIIRSIHEFAIFLLSFLEDFPEKAKRWEGKMRDLAHQTEDIIEHYMSQQSYNRWIILTSAKFEEQLRNVTEKLCLMAGDVMDERPAYLPLAVSSSSSSSSSSRVAATGNGAVIGLADDLMEIKERLCGMSSKLQIIPIVGMGGIGKTTLATTLYNDPLIIEYFDIRVWLTISQDYTVGKVLLGFLDSIKQECLCVKDSKELVEEEMSGDDIDDFTMAEKVYKNLKGRRYLIVMDDVWSTNVWDDVRNIFPDDGIGSRIMLTTRLSDLAACPNSSTPLHKMRLMNYSQCWDLLKGKVFANSNCPPELEGVGKEIARSCAGLPLAVVLVAGFLSVASKTPSSWEEISKNVKPVVGQQLEGILSLSYTQLPHHLRPCFLYMGLFPEDEKIRASTLTRLWLAEGFLKQENRCSKSPEEKAEEYLEDLVERNIITVTSRKTSGKIKSCSLHDMVRDLCIRKAGEEKFLGVMDRGVVLQGMINERRISFRKSDLDTVWGPTIRTILCFKNSKYLDFPHKDYPSSSAFSKRIRLVRVLDAVGDKSKELPSQVFELFHLRYLALLSSSSNIPSAISNLTHLQTLIILPTDSQQKKRVGVAKFLTHSSLPSEIWRMPQLRHLVFSCSYTISDPPHGSTLPLENLQTFWGVASLVCSERTLKLIPNIKRLGIVYYMNEDYRLHNLVHLCKLQVLEITTFRDSSWQRQNPRFPCSLTKLSLYSTQLPWKDMTVVGALPNLQVLKLRRLAYDGNTWETNDGEFLQLKFLLIQESNLQHWITETSHFPRLKSLVLYECPALSRIPEDVGEIPTLELIEVDEKNKSLVDSAKQIQQDQLENYGNDTLQVRCIQFYMEKRS